MQGRQATSPFVNLVSTHPKTKLHHQPKLWPSPGPRDHTDGSTFFVASDVFPDKGESSSSAAIRPACAREKSARGHSGSEACFFRRDGVVSVAVTRMLLPCRVAEILARRCRYLRYAIVETFLTDAFQLRVGGMRVIGVRQTGNCV